MAAPRTPVAPFVVSYGGEDLLLDRDIERARQWTNRTVTMIDGPGLDDRELVSMLEARDFEGGNRTIILEEANKLKGDKALKEYIANKVPTDLSVVLVAIVRSEKLPDIWSKAMAKGKGYEHKILKTWESNNEVVKWIGREAERLRLSFEKGLDLLLFQLVGADLYRLANEMKKLSILVGPQGRITKEHLALVVTKTSTAEPFTVAEAAISKQPKRAMNALSIIYKNSGDDSLVLIVSSLMRQVEKTLVARSLLDKGASKDDIASAVGLKPWLVENVAIPNARKHDRGSLIRHMGRLCKLDADVKGPARSKRTLVELAVLSIAG